MKCESRWKWTAKSNTKNIKKRNQRSGCWMCGRKRTTTWTKLQQFPFNVRWKWGIFWRKVVLSTFTADANHSISYTFCSLLVCWRFFLLFCTVNLQVMRWASLRWGAQVYSGVQPGKHRHSEDGGNSGWWSKLAPLVSVCLNRASFCVNRTQT